MCSNNLFVASTDYDIIFRGNPFKSKMAAGIDPVEAVSFAYPYSVYIIRTGLDANMRGAIQGL